MIHQAGAKLFYLPSYSPDLNSTEKLWAKVKAFLRKRRALTPEALQRRDRLRLPVLHLLIAETGLHFLAEMDLNGISIFNVGSNTVTLASGWDLMAFIRQMISPENGGDAQ